jgi:hypothetical protein
VSEGVLQAAQVLRAALGSFDPARWSGSDCARLAEELAATEKACGAAASVDVGLSHPTFGPV